MSWVAPRDKTDARLAVALIAVPILSILTLYTRSAVATAAGSPQVCLCIAIDGSGSIDSSDFSLVRSGLANAVNDATIVPHDGTVARC